MTVCQWKEKQTSIGLKIFHLINKNILILTLCLIILCLCNKILCFVCFNSTQRIKFLDSSVCSTMKNAWPAPLCLIALGHLQVKCFRCQIMGQLSPYPASMYSSESLFTPGKHPQMSPQMIPSFVLPPLVRKRRSIMITPGVTTFILNSLVRNSLFISLTQ